MSELWNPWHGCKRYSEGCLHCYVFRIDGKTERNTGDIKRNNAFGLPLESGRNGYRIKPGEEVYTCLTSDFFLEEADGWRSEAWEIIKRRPDLRFNIITKRILRFEASLPSDWGDGYDNVAIGCTCENQKRADERLPYFLAAPIKHKFIVCEPLLEKINLAPYLDASIEEVTVGGESGDGARVCDYDWVLGIRDACIGAGVPFHYHQTGANFRRNGVTYSIPRKFQHSQADKAGINTR